MMDASDHDSAKRETVNTATASQVPLVHPESPVARRWCRSQMEVHKFSFTWTIDKFPFRKEADDEGSFLESSIFSVGSTGKLEWKLQMYPKTKLRGACWISVFLVLVSSCESGVFAKFEFFILNAEGEKVKNSTGERCTVFGKGESYGIPVILRDDLVNKYRELMSDDNLTIICDGSFALEKVDEFGPTNQLQDQVAERKLSQDLGSLLENQKLADVTLSVGGKDLRVHKAILAARSPVFAAMFEYEMRESRESRVVMQDVSYDAVKEMVEYIYTGKSSNVGDMAEDILELADKYDLDGLKATCEAVLCSKITVENAANLLVLAEMYSAKQLEAQVGHFISIRPKEVMLTPGWKHMSLEYPQLLIKAFETLALR